MLHKYKPETKQEKKARLLKAAENKAKDPSKAGVETAKAPNVVKFGINHVTALIEQKKAKLVVIAHDVDPVELVVWLPALCRKMGVPYVIVKSKARLGQVVHQKTATALALVNTNKEDQADLAQLVSYARENYNDKYDETRRNWGGGRRGFKSTIGKFDYRCFFWSLKLTFFFSSKQEAKGCSKGTNSKANCLNTKKDLMC